MDKDQMHGLLYEALETEKGGVLVYETALRCVLHDDLRSEWEKYLAQTRDHVLVLIDVLKELGLNPDQDTPGRTVVRHVGLSLVRTMEIALLAGKPAAAQIVAAEAVVQAETKDHLNWKLIGLLTKALSGPEQELLQRAYDQVEDEEDEHLYHSAGWARELHMEALGLPAVLPPPEEEEQVKSASEAERAAKKARKPVLTQKRGDPDGKNGNRAGTRTRS